MECKKGDKVLLRSDLVPEQRYGNETWFDVMKKGCVVTIRHAADGDYMIEEGGWIYTDEMIEKKIEA